MLQAASRQFADSVLQLSVDQLANIGSVGGGSRVLEAFLDNSSSTKAAKKLLRKLYGTYGKLAASPSGCFLVEKCFSSAVWPIRAVHHHVTSSHADRMVIGQYWLALC